MKLVLTPKGERYDYETPYNKPELYGLERVAEIQWGEPDYSFDLTCVLRRTSDGTLWYASDSGCSCPSPFEDAYEWDRLFNLEPLAPPAEDYRQPNPQEYRDFLEKVNQAFAELRARG